MNTFLLFIYVLFYIHIVLVIFLYNVSAHPECYSTLFVDMAVWLFTSRNTNCEMTWISGLFFSSSFWISDIKRHILQISRMFSVIE